MLKPHQVFCVSKLEKIKTPIIRRDGNGEGDGSETIWKQAEDNLPMLGYLTNTVKAHMISRNMITQHSIIWEAKFCQ